MQDQPSPHRHSLISPLLPPNASPAPSPHTQLQASPMQDGTHRVRAELSGSTAGGAHPHPRDFPLVPRVCQFSAGQALGLVPEGDSPAGEPGRGGLAGPYPPPSPPSRTIPNPTNLTRESHGIFSLTFLSSWRRVNNRPEGRMAGPQAATICRSGRPAATRLQVDGEIPHTSPQP